MLLLVLLMISESVFATTATVADVADVGGMNEEEAVDDDDVDD